MPSLACRLTILTLLIALVAVQTACHQAVPRNTVNTHEQSFGIGKPATDERSDFHPEVVINRLLASPAPISDEHPQRPREVLGFYTDPEPSYPGSQPIVDQYSSSISSIAPFWYKLDDLQPGHLIHEGNEESQRQVIQRAHDKGLHVYLLVHNLFYGTVTRGKEVASTVLRNEKYREQLIRNLRNEIKKFDYDGINIDIENLFIQDRDAFTAFMKQLASDLHKDDKIVTVSVPANTGDARANAWAAWFDYAALGKLVDRLVLMTYDEHNPRTSPGAVASIDWVESTVRYALSQGVPSGKILVGIAGYGWNWGAQGTKALYSSYALTKYHQQKAKAPIHWDNQSQAPYFSYTDEQNIPHHVWFENSYSLRFKLQLVKKYDLQGIAIWRLGLEDPAVWTTISSLIPVRKFPTQ